MPRTGQDVYPALQERGCLYRETETWMRGCARIQIRVGNESGSAGYYLRLPADDFCGRRRFFV